MTTKQTDITQINSAQLLGQDEQHLCYLSERVAIHQEMKNAFEALAAAANIAGINLKIASGFRSFDRQVMLWNNKFSGKTPIKDITGAVVSPEGLSPLELIHSILLYSALPGASRHHWGCDIDVYAPNLLTPDYQLQLEPWEYSEQGPLAKLSAWLIENAHSYGFYFPYASFQGGVAEEPWHLSYLPLAQQYQQAFDVERLALALSSSNILGKAVIIENLDNIAKRYINNVCAAPSNVILTGIPAKI